MREMTVGQMPKWLAAAVTVMFGPPLIPWGLQL